MSNIKKIFPILMLFASSCAKEIYTNKDAEISKREAQKVGLTVIIRDIDNQPTKMSGFKITTTQCGELIESVTSADGIANMLIVKGDAALNISKEGYVPTTAIITTNATEKERNNTVVVIPVFSERQQSGSISGIVSVIMPSPSEEPLVNALVNIDMDMNELMRWAFPDLGGNIGKYCPGALTYSLANMMQPVRTDAFGAFQLTIPITGVDLKYTINVHETALTKSANRTVVTNGQNSPTVLLQLAPYEN